MPVNDLSLVIAGAAGEGVFASATVFAKACVRGGLHVFVTNEYRSLIRGGHQWCSVRVSSREVYSQVRRIDLLVALNSESVKKHIDRLHESSGVIVDAQWNPLPSVPGRLYPVPMAEMVRKVGGKPVMKNAVALGAAAGLLGYDIDLLVGVIQDTFRRAAELNTQLARMGYEYARENYGDFAYKLEKQGCGDGMILVSGNEAVALGALKAGMTFFAAYPMTPASPILHFLARLQRDYGIVAIQPESEIAAINMAIGAAYAGARSMVATSGGGFSLMTEAFGFAAMTETPIVVALVQRPGPSTGLPTYTSQGDLRFVLHASQGEFPRVVVAPGDVDEAYRLTVEAFNMAWKYQVPAVVLLDKYLGESSKSTREFGDVEVEEGEVIRGSYRGEKYARYRITETGVSPMAVPGTENAIVKANSSEHDEYGIISSDPETVVAMVDKRFRKVKYMLEEVESKRPVRVYGDPGAELAVISWGSTKGPILEALKVLEERGIKVGFIQILWLSPFPSRSVKRAIASKRLLLVENTKTGLLESLLREHLLVDVDHRLLKYDGRPFDPCEIVEKVEEVV